MASYTDRLILLDASGRQVLAHSTDSIVVSSDFTTNRTLSIGQGLVSNIVSKTADYTMLFSDYIISIGTLSSPITITLPALPSNGATYIISDSKGSAASYSIVVDGNGNNISGRSTYNLNIRYESVTVVFDNANETWIIV
jgi:hypothetical protein